VNDLIVHTPDDGFCDDGEYCNGAETCDAINDCQPGTPPSLDDGVDCTIDTCDEVNDVIVHTPDDGFCDDGEYCNGAETCDAINDCQPGADPCAPLACDEVDDVCIPAPRVANLELFYAGRFDDEADPTYDFLAAGSTASVDNITNYVHGITGIRVFFDAVVEFATTPDVAFSFEWTTGTGTTFTPVTGASTAISVTAVEQDGATVVTIIIDDDHARRRWLKVSIDAAQVSMAGMDLDGGLTGNPVGLPSGDGLPGGDSVFYIGNLSCDVDGDRRTLLTDAGLVRAMVNPFLYVPITNPYDVDKDRRVLLTDAGEARADVNPFYLLPLISP
jgi:hypothetical protein